MKEKIAIVHDYFHTFGGGEKVVESLLEVFEEAVIFTTFYIPESFPNDSLIHKAWQEGRIKTTFEQKLLGTSSKMIWFKHLFWLHPFAMSRHKIIDCDKVIISSVYSAKNIRIDPRLRGKVVVYSHSPTRFLHGLTTETDHSKFNIIQNLILAPIKAILKRNDLRAVRRLVNLDAKWYVNSNYIKEITKNVYNVESEVLYPPVELNKKKLKKRENYYIFYSRLVRHKRLDLAIQGAILAQVKLKIIGKFTDASYKQEIDQLLKNYSIKDQELIDFVGWLPADKRDRIISGAKAMLFPGIEDFGIAPIEALSYGVPLIAFGEGGVLEYLQIENKKILIDGAHNPQKIDFFINKLKNSDLVLEDIGIVFGMKSSKDYQESLRLLNALGGNFYFYDNIKSSNIQGSSTISNTVKSFDMVPSSKLVDTINKLQKQVIKKPIHNSKFALDPETGRHMEIYPTAIESLSFENVVEALEYSSGKHRLTLVVGTMYSLEDLYTHL